MFSDAQFNADFVEDSRFLFAMLLAPRGFDGAGQVRRVLGKHAGHGTWLQHASFGVFAKAPIKKMKAADS